MLLKILYIFQTTKFCDDSNHDRTAPNRQNHFCRNRSIKTVIENSRDFRGVNQPLPQTTNTMPTFNIQVAASKVVYVVLDTSTYDGKDEVIFYSNLQRGHKIVNKQ